MALKKNGRMNLSINPDTVMSEDATMLVLGEYRTMQKYFRT